MNIIFQINGGIGKSVMATAVCKAIKIQHPNCKLIVITGYPDVFSNNPFVEMVFNFGQESYFYTKYVENQDVKIFANEPYLVTEHILCKEHLIETWCKMNGISYNGEMPEIYINEREFNFYGKKYSLSKPIMILQTNGGGQTDIKYSWARDMPKNIVISIIDEFKDKYDICHIRRDDQLAYDNTIHIQESFKGIACLIASSQKRVLIDSFCQHTAAALSKKSTVLWIVNKPSVFGYDIHENILSNVENGTPDIRNSQFTKYNIGGSLNEFPYKTEKDIFNIDKIITSILNQ